MPDTVLSTTHLLPIGCTWLPYRICIAIPTVRVRRLRKGAIICSTFTQWICGRVDPSCQTSALTLWIPKRNCSYSRRRGGEEKSRCGCLVRRLFLPSRAREIQAWSMWFKWDGQRGMDRLWFSKGSYLLYTPNTGHLATSGVILIVRTWEGHITSIKW